MVDRELVEI